MAHAALFATKMRLIARPPLQQVPVPLVSSSELPMENVSNALATNSSVFRVRAPLALQENIRSTHKSLVAKIARLDSTPGVTALQMWMTAMA
jgi:hypothetical protein